MDGERDLTTVAGRTAWLAARDMARIVADPDIGVSYDDLGAFIDGDLELTEEQIEISDGYHI